LREANIESVLADMSPVAPEDQPDVGMFNAAIAATQSQTR
jgi:hypothetical protein